jgi:hypothetical protein
MSPESIIYIQLLGEDVDVWRPVTAAREANDTYRLLDQQPDSETWAFPPGSRVRCERRTISKTSELVACSLVDQPGDLAEWQAWWKREGRDGLNALLVTEWNPIGTRVPENEYSSYAGHIGRLLRERGSEADIAAYLHSVRIERMGLSPDPYSDRRVASQVFGWYVKRNGIDDGHAKNSETTTSTPARPPNRQADTPGLATAELIPGEDEVAAADEGKYNKP